MCPPLEGLLLFEKENASVLYSKLRTDVPEEIAMIVAAILWYLTILK
jgi:hypothetical protein